MTRIQVLGPGCTKCQVLYEHAKSAADELGLDYSLEKVTDMADIVAHGVLTTPALVVDGQVKVAGRVPSAEKLKEMLR